MFLGLSEFFWFALATLFVGAYVATKIRVIVNNRNEQKNIDRRDSSGNGDTTDIVRFRDRKNGTDC